MPRIVTVCPRGMNEMPPPTTTGVSETPSRRKAPGEKITDKSDPPTQITTEDRWYVRWSVFTAIDVTVFPF
jgi:hypothetical protein